MFSLRRKPKRTQEKATHSTPSLPEVGHGSIPWPANLVDVDSLDKLSQPSNDGRYEGATKTSLQGPLNAPIPFHKPFRPSTSGSNPSKPQQASGPISSLYMHPPSAFDNWKPSTGAGAKMRYTHSQRRMRTPPTFNVMVIGGQGTGKTSLLRLLLETADISPTATVDQKLVVEKFLRGHTRPTQTIQTTCVEITESRFDRVLLSVVDTPGLDYGEGRELKLERQVSSVMRYIDAQYADTMSEESKVIRKSKGDQHIHLCIYLVDPASIMSNSERRARSSLPTKTRSDTTLSQRNPPDLIPDISSDEDEDVDKEDPIKMSPSEIRVIKRLSTRCNLLPVIAKADSLTDEKLDTIKEAVRVSLAEAGLDFGVFGSSDKSKDRGRRPSLKADVGRPGNINGNGNTIPKTHFAVGSDANDSGVGDEEDSDNSDEEEEKYSRPVIKLRTPRHPGRTLSRSRSRRDLSQAAEDERRPMSPDLADRESVANVRFSAHIVARPDLTAVMPFALIAPESSGRSRRQASSTSEGPASPPPQSEEGAPETPLSTTGSQMNLAYLNGPPEDMRGVFVRKYRWGTIDVLDPYHCDFAALRTAVLSTHLKVLKTHTKEVLYEKYRTEKLLARRATRQITDEERQRLLEDVLQELNPTES